MAPTKNETGEAPPNGAPPPLKKRRIGVMTSGGDAPGMNGAVRAVVRMSLHMNCEAYAIFEGYEGLVLGGDLIKQMAWDDVRGFLSRGGTLIGTARCMAFMERAGRLKAAKNMVLRGIDALVICGGDGSLTGADKFRAEWPSLLDELVSNGELTSEQIAPYSSLNIVGLVGSIDNDMSGTDATIGCYSALERICGAVDDVFDTAASHQRGFVIEVMGRHCGWLALMASIATGADYVFIPERPPRVGWEDQMCGIVKRHRERGKRRTIVIVAEGAHDENLTKITPNQVKDLLTTHLKLDTRVTILGHTQRGGQACYYDRWLSSLQGVEAVNAVLEATPDTPSPVITIRENKIERSNLMEAVKLTKSVSAAIEARDFDKAMELRDVEFKEYYRSYMITTSTDHPKLRLPKEKHLRVAIVHVGAPAGGMNPASRAAVAYCLTRGHTPIAIHNGFPGLQRHHDDKPIGSVREVDWINADSWVNEGGSDIGTNRGLPSADIKKTAECFELYKFDALFVVGGFEAFTAVSEMRRARVDYPSFCIPMVVLPATVSNNVPGTEYSLGSDTCLNTLIGFCDAIRQSASSSRRRVFVIETQGGRSGYVATMAGLSIGALAVYIPEDPPNIHTIAKDIEFLRENFANDRGASRAGKIILNNEKASETYTTEIIANMIKEEAKGRFEAKSAVPGHYQQGGKPSPMDRVRAMRMSIKCMQFIEGFTGKDPQDIAADNTSASVIGIQGSEVVFSSMGGEDGLEATATDWKDRRPKDEFWYPLKDIVDILSGRPKPGAYCTNLIVETSSSNGSRLVTVILLALWALLSFSTLIPTGRTQGLLAVPFVLSSRPTAGLEGEDDVASLKSMKDAAHRRYADIFRDVEALVEDHRKHQSSQQISKLKMLVPSIGSFFTPLYLEAAFVYQDKSRAISSRRFVAPSFNDIRLVLNVAQIMALVRIERLPISYEMILAISYKWIGSAPMPAPLKLITFDGDVTLYDDGASLTPENPVIHHILHLLSEDVCIGIVTAAGYTDASRYHQRLHGLLDAIAASQLPRIQKENLIIMGGESNYLFVFDPDSPHKLRYINRRTWILPTMLSWNETSIQALLSVAETALQSCIDALRLPAEILRKERAVGIIPSAGRHLIREQLEETVLVVQHLLETSNVVRDAGIPFCAFNGGNDVFVDIGDKSLGVQSCQKWFGGIEPACTLHVGDQFLSGGGNDFKARLASTTAWIAGPSETVELLDQMISLSGVSMDSRIYYPPDEKCDL